MLFFSITNVRSWDVLIARGRASVSEIQTSIADPPGYSAVRATLRIREEKGYPRHEKQGANYVYLPKAAPQRAKLSALRHVLDTFFRGSPEQVVTALLDGRTTPEELDRIAVMIKRARGRCCSKMAFASNKRPGRFI